MSNKNLNRHMANHYEKYYNITFTISNELNGVVMRVFDPTCSLRFVRDFNPNKTSEERGYGGLFNSKTPRYNRFLSIFSI